MVVFSTKIETSSLEHEFVGRKPTHQQLLEESKKMRSENEQLKERVSTSFMSRMAEKALSWKKKLYNKYSFNIYASDCGIAAPRSRFDNNE